MTTLQQILQRMNNSSLTKKSEPILNLIERDDDREVNFKDDPIALAWARHKKSQTMGYIALGETEVTPEDRVVAEQIKRYYRDRYAMHILRGNQLSDFRTKLYGLVQGLHGLKTKDLGLLYKLPGFYEEDQFLDKLAVEDFAPVTNFDQLAPRSTWRLNAHSSYKSTRNHAVATHYFWTNVRNQLVCWSVPSNNTLMTMVQGLFDRRLPLHVDANYVITKRHISRELCFYRVVAPRLVLE